MARLPTTFIDGGGRSSVLNDLQRRLRLGRTEELRDVLNHPALRRDLDRIAAARRGELGLTPRFDDDRTGPVHGERTLPIDITIPDREPFDPGDILGRPPALRKRPLPDDFFKPAPPREVPKVVVQGPEAGQVVPRGTAIDLVVTQPRSIPVGVIEGVFEEFRDRTAVDIWTRFLEKEIEVSGTQIDPEEWVQARSAEDLTDEDLEVLKVIVDRQDEQVEIGDVDRGREVLRGLQAGALFAGNRVKTGASSR
ncbi:MAG: hypothetical protein AAGC60_20455 [Acidobacteriota bacterium]